MVPANNDKPTATFGLEDGTSSAMGVILGAGISLGTRGLLVAAVALAVSASVSMAGGQWLATGDKRQATIMGLSTTVGSFFPAVPWLFLSGLPAFALCILVALFLGALIAELRPGPRASSYAVTFGVLGVATGAAVGASLIAGALA